MTPRSAEVRSPSSRHEVEAALHVALGVGVPPSRLFAGIQFEQEDWEATLRDARIARGFRRIARECAATTGHRWKKLDKDRNEGDLFGCLRCGTSTWAGWGKRPGRTSARETFSSLLVREARTGQRELSFLCDRDITADELESYPNVDMVDPNLVDQMDDESIEGGGSE